MNYTLHSGSISTFHLFYRTELLGKDSLKPLSLCLYNFLDISSNSTNKTVIENVCYTTGAVIGCLARETTNQLPMYLSLVKRITSHLEHFMELACSEGKVTNIQQKYSVMASFWHERRCEKSGLRGFRQGLIQAHLYSHRSRLDA